MAKLLIPNAAKYFQDKGDIAITRNYLYQGCREGRIPHARAGNRYIIDTEEVELYLKAEMENSIKQNEEIGYGKLRPIPSK